MTSRSDTPVASLPRVRLTPRDVLSSCMLSTEFPMFWVLLCRVSQATAATVQIAMVTKFHSKVKLCFPWRLPSHEGQMCLPDGSAMQQSTLVDI